MAIPVALISVGANLLVELISSGVSIASMIEKAKESPRVSPEEWRFVMAEIKSAEDLWESS